MQPIYNVANFFTSLKMNELHMKEQMISQNMETPGKSTQNSEKSLKVNKKENFW